MVTSQLAKKVMVAAAALALGSAGATADGIIGLGDTPHHSEFLFGFSGVEAEASLSLNGGMTVLNPFTAADGANSHGWWSGSNVNNAANDNIFVGDISDNGSELLNNFFSFDISNVTGPVLSATLRVQRNEGASGTGLLNHTYNLFDVSTDFGTLNANNGTDAGIFNDLGSGTAYGSYVISLSGDPDEILDLELNAAALADLNSAIRNQARVFSIGGSLTPGGTRDVPDAGSSLALLGLSAGCLAFVARKKRA